ncbi:MAG: hypothetical protein OEW99_12260 [Gammaproteobacteria bacterium]|nr:hypothetical protein [Gammaproteobacteria bacterium]MDH5659418.1 hypothetical protein [Gammaproteobacteria bacterium]
MKFKYIILLGVIGAASFYFYQDNTLRLKFMGKVHQLAPELNQSTLYKWQNNKGEWQITDKPPGKGIAFTTVNSQDQINVMPGSSSQQKK